MRARLFGLAVAGALLAPLHGCGGGSAAHDGATDARDTAGDRKPDAAGDDRPSSVDAPTDVSIDQQVDQAADRPSTSDAAPDLPADTGGPVDSGTGCVTQLILLARGGTTSACSFKVSSSIPHDRVIPDREVSYRLDWGAATPHRTLVYPEDLQDEAGQISLLSPIGTALLGMRQGDQMLVFLPESGFHKLYVESVRHPGAIPGRST